MNNLQNFTLLLLLTTMLLFDTALAQKLPQVQKESMRAPAGIKADGKATEWGAQFRAYNDVAKVWYSMANDDDKLYFIIHAENADVIHKMMRGCVTIFINTTSKKNHKNAMSFTFPSYLPKDAPNVSLANKPKPNGDTAKFKIQTDSFAHLMNKRLGDKEKFIVISGMKNISDSLVSVYNEDGIKAKILLDNQLNYNYELAVPLKYLGLSVNSPQKFTYNIVLNGTTPKDATMEAVSRGRIVITIPGQLPTVTKMSAQNNILMYPTDFWGEYTLVRSY